MEYHLVGVRVRGPVEEVSVARIGTVTTQPQPTEVSLEDTGDMTARPGGRSLRQGGMTAQHQPTEVGLEDIGM